MKILIEVVGDLGKNLKSFQCEHVITQLAEVSS